MMPPRMPEITPIAAAANDDDGAEHHDTADVHPLAIMGAINTPARRSWAPSIGDTRHRNRNDAQHGRAATFNFTVKRVL